MITERQQKLLDFIVRRYVRTAEPVGSAQVVEKSNFEVSPATIRNEMQVLEEMGYLMHPHTSAGRVPTDKAYRLFVNGLLEQENFDIESSSKRKIDAAFNEVSSEPRQINRAVAQVLNELTDNLVIVNDSESDEFYQKGLSSLLELPEFREFHRMLQVTNFFDQFDEFFQQFERQFFREINQVQHFKVFIGRENPFGAIADETMIHTKYQLPQGRIGSLTVIGPIRMDYEYNLGLVNYLADKVNELTERIKNERQRQEQ
jgi:transcriptional regulator of heat shock response